MIGTPVRLWHIIFEFLASISGVLFFAETLSGIMSSFIGINIPGLKVAMALLCFVLVPVVFAFSIIIKKIVLLLIPVVIIPLFVIVEHICFCLRLNDYRSITERDSD